MYNYFVKMPENEDFCFKILIGGTAIPEYQRNGRYYVESNLSTPFSYQQNVTQLVNGQNEVQSMPVTPYQIEVRSKPSAPPCFYKIKIDGIKIKSLGIGPGVKKLIRGFRDNDVIREFLFSLPDMNEERGLLCSQGEVGTIEIECWNAVLRKKKIQAKHSQLRFKQANKKDSLHVTGGDYTMATSAVGKIVGPRSITRRVDYWNRLSLRSKLTVRYHMGHTLREMGFVLLPLPGSHPRSSCTQGCQSNSSGRQDCQSNSLPSNNLSTLPNTSCKQEPQEPDIKPALSGNPAQSGSADSHTKAASVLPQDSLDDEEVVFLRVERPRAAGCQCSCTCGSQSHSSQGSQLNRQQDSSQASFVKSKTESPTGSQSLLRPVKSEPPNKTGKENIKVKTEKEVQTMSNGSQHTDNNSKNQSGDSERPDIIDISDDENGKDCEIVEKENEAVMIDITAEKETEMNTS